MSADRVTITVRLTPNMNDRLEALCEHLGTNRNSYLVNAIGKAISKDEMSFMVQQNSTEMFSQLSTFINAIQDKNLES